MGHEPSRFVPLDPDLEDENELLVLVPLLMEELVRAVRSEPQPQSTSILTGRGHVEELLMKRMRGLWWTSAIKAKPLHES